MFDTRVLENLNNQTNQTCSDKNMWLVQYNNIKKPTLFINFGTQKNITGFRVWNYNKSTIDSSRGVKRLKITADINNLTQDTEGIFLRSAPGHTHFDYSQFISFPITQVKKINKSSFKKFPKSDAQLCYPPLKPNGFSLRIVILSTWGDSHYVGMNRIEIFNDKGDDILPHAEIYADPSDLTLTGNYNDERKVENLKRGAVISSEGKDIWLVPFINPKIKDDILNFNRSLNQMFINFNDPVTISCIKFWNYTRTVQRGVKEIELYLDDNIVFKGQLKPANNPYEPTLCSTSIIFTGNELLLKKIQAEPYLSLEGQPIAYSNEGTVSIFPTKHHFSPIKFKNWIVF